MEEGTKALFERLEKVPEEVNVNAVFGAPQTVEGRTLIPVAELSYGFGVGICAAPCAPGQCECGEAGDEDEEGAEVDGGAGGGAAAHARPVAYIEIGPEGTQVQSIVNEQKIALAGIFLGIWAVGWAGLALTSLFGRRRS